MQLLPKCIRFFVDIDTFILKFIPQSAKPRIGKTILKKSIMWEESLYSILSPTI